LGFFRPGEFSNILLLEKVQQHALQITAQPGRKLEFLKKKRGKEEASSMLLVHDDKRTGAADYWY
jgi:hypothetical protein